MFWLQCNVQDDLIDGLVWYCYVSNRKVLGLYYSAARWEKHNVTNFAQLFFLGLKFL